jgi:PAS domain S-box-containing protein
MRGARVNQQKYGTSQAEHLKQSTRRFTIGLLTTGNFLRYAPGHWLGVIDTAREQDANVVCFLGEAPHSPQGFYDSIFAVADVAKAIGSPGEFRGPASTIFDLVDSGVIDGLIVWTSILNWFSSQQQMEAFCKQYHLPVVSAEVAFANIPSVLIDDYGGMYSVVSHLIETHGYQRIAFLRGAENHVGMRERYRGYVAALADHGLALDLNLVTPPTSWDGRIDMKVLLDERGLQPQIDFDAVVGVGGSLVFGIHMLFEERGIQVPSDVAVVGFDNPMELAIHIPPYTMVDPQVYEVGKRTVELMLALLRGEAVPDSSTVPARLIVRRSCGCLDRIVSAADSGAPRSPHTARPAEYAANEGIAGVLVARREELLAEIAQASGIDCEQSADFLDAFSAAVKDATPDRFLSRLEVLMHQTIATNTDPVVWHDALSTLRRASHNLGSIEVSSQMEDIWQQARVLIGETARRTQAYQAMSTEQRSLMLREVESALLNTYDIRELADVLARSLSHLGIPSAYLSLYEHPHSYEQTQAPPEWSRLIVACDDGGRVDFDAEGRRFRTCQLAPQGILLQELRYRFVAEPLYFREHNLGFALFEIGPREGIVYETLREGISNALYGDWLLRERQQAEEALRLQAVELELHQREQRHRSMLERVVRAGKAMTQAADLRTCLLNIRNSVQRELDFDRIGVFLYDAERNVISGSFGTDRAGKLTEEWNAVIPIFPDAPHRILLLEPDRFVFTSDYQATYNPPPGNTMVGVKQHAMVGVWADDQPIAILVVDNLLTQRPMTEEQLEALRLAAGYVALAIKNARLLDQAREAEQKYRSIFVNSLEGIAQITVEGRFLSANPAMARILGYDTPTDLLASLFDIQNDLVVDPTRRQELKRLLEEQGVVRDFEYQIRRRDGRLAWVSLNARLLRTSQNTYIEGSWQDITERRQLEAQLLKSQKMEAIGQLAGGIAHDFNNLLVVISGGTDLVSDALKPNDPIQDDLREIQRAAHRAANLTRQLLTFARRQASALQVLNLNDLIVEIDKLLRRLIREDIMLKTSLAPDLWLVQADPGQIEQVLMNLVINARDAMPHGGTIIIECSNVMLDQEYARVRPTMIAGSYVRLVVTDTGTGMTEEVLQHAFEPFFTTKDPGQGTGLGLATCYGIIKQHGGSSELDSEVGRGTSVKVYLPRAAGTTTAPIPSQESTQIPGGTETVLLVEDEPAVQALTARILRRRGYTVLEASNGIEALDVVQRHIGAPIDLLVTDTIMPKLGGYELAEQLRQIIPGIRVLFMSGYGTNVVLQNELLDHSTTFIQKPFTVLSLARSVRALLDR